MDLEQEKIFDGLFKDRGGSLYLYNQEMYGLYVNYIEEIYDFINFKRITQPELPIPYISIINNYEINAVATLYNKKYYIGVHVGGILYIQDIFMRLLSHPDVIPEIDDIKSEIAPEKVVNLELFGYFHYHDVIGIENTPVPKSILRRQLGSLLRTFAVQYLFLHEYGHIINGHVGYLAKETGKQLLDEGENYDNIISPLTFQTLEFDADCWAYSALAFMTIRAVKEKHSANIKKIAFNKLSSALYLMAFSIYTMHKISVKEKEETDLSKLSHPIPEVRQAYLLTVITSFVDKYHPEETDPVMQICSQAVNDVEEGFALVSENVSSRKKFLDEFQVEMPYSMVLRNNWKNIRPLLEPFATTNLVAIQEDYKKPTPSF